MPHITVGTFIDSETFLEPDVVSGTFSVRFTSETRFTSPRTFLVLIHIYDSIHSG